MSNLEVFVSRLRRLLWEFKSYGDFCEEVGITYQALKNWLAFRGFPRAEILIEICQARSVSSDWLLGLNDDPGRELVPWKSV